jgi:predicted transcriptional regulator
MASQIEVQQAEMEKLMEKTFEGSIPAFLAAFANTKKLREEDVRQLEELIKNYKE